MQVMRRHSRTKDDTTHQRSRRSRFRKPLDSQTVAPCRKISERTDMSDRKLFVPRGIEAPYVRLPII
jgi:hypothetical protein